VRRPKKLRLPRERGVCVGIAKAKRKLRIADIEQLFLRFGDDFRRVYARFDGPKEIGPEPGLSPGVTYRTPFGLEREGFGYDYRRSNSESLISAPRPLQNAYQLPTCGTHQTP